MFYRDQPTAAQSDGAADNCATGSGSIFATIDKHIRLFTMRMPVTHERNVIRLWSIIVINRALSVKQTWETGMNTREERVITRYVSVIFFHYINIYIYIRQEYISTSKDNEFVITLLTKTIFLKKNLIYPFITCDHVKFQITIFR